MSRAQNGQLGGQSGRSVALGAADPRTRRAGVGFTASAQFLGKGLKLDPQGKIAVTPAEAVDDLNETVSITDPADAPASADALRDDLVANTIPAIETSLSTVIADLNAIKSALRMAGLMED